ncbi:MAG: apolipoprotein N-acyltransferase [Endomicrobiia bacterium]|nr:apolipoprotein N-acyltransferase [Endomicrobiia bacterium]
MAAEKFRYTPMNLSTRSRVSSGFLLPTAIFASAAAIALSFPPFSLWPLAYFFAAPLLYLARRLSALRAATAAFLAGLAGYGVILYWIFPTVVTHAGSRVQAVIALLLLAAYPSAYLAAFVGISGILFKKSSVFGRFGGGLVMAATPAAWVALEYVRSVAFTGFPWAIAGYSQWNFSEILWIARFAGVFGVSFMIMLANTVAADVLFAGAGLRHKIAFGFLAAWFMTGACVRVFRAPPSAAALPAQSISVAVIQPNIDQEKKWDVRYFSETKEKISRLVLAVSRRTAVARGGPPELILWPETSLTEVLSDSSGAPSWMRELSKSSRLPQIVGTHFEDDGKIYNAAVVIAPDGKIASVHKKTHLVPFGEFVPFRRLLEPYFGVFNYIGDTAKGGEHTVLSVGGKKISTVICSENLYGNVTRRFVAKGAEAMLVITNDAWYGMTPAAFQHFTFNVFRAVENSRWIIQSANTGVSGVISSDGRIMKQTSIFEEAWFVASAPLESRRTFYSRVGDLFAIICVVFTLALVVSFVIVNEVNREVQKGLKNDIRTQNSR